MSKLPIVTWRGEEIPQLVLGTAQLGMPGYGVGDRDGELSRERAAELIGTAWNEGVRFFDTAQEYGDSEEKLGKALVDARIAVDQPGIITKLNPGQDPLDCPAVLAGLERSHAKLGVPRLWGVMLHHFSRLESWRQGLGDCLEGFKADGRARFLGVSVYSVVEALAAIAHPAMDIIQIPANAWDWRMLEAGVFAAAEKAGKLLFVRSVFLQGLLFLDPDTAETRVKGASVPARTWGNLCARLGRTRLELALGNMKAFNCPLVVGADSPKRMAEIAAVFAGNHPSADAAVCQASMSVHAVESVLDPRCWR